MASFTVDERGGTMRGGGRSGFRLIIPPGRATTPTTITCGFMSGEEVTLLTPPPLMDGEALAAPVLVFGPMGTAFTGGPVVVELGHWASLRPPEREIIVLRSDSGDDWREHLTQESAEGVGEVLAKCSMGETSADRPIVRIVTADLPRHFAVITRVRQEVSLMGPKGGVMRSTVAPRVKAVFPVGALTKDIRVGLQVLPIAADLVADMFGNRMAVSDVCTVEPRRRKFHKPITLAIPVRQVMATEGKYKKKAKKKLTTDTIRLLCSISGGTAGAQWEDVTGSTAFTLEGDCLSFTTTVSARFWLVDCREPKAVTEMAAQLYREAIRVPFGATVVAYGRRLDRSDGEIRLVCTTGDDADDEEMVFEERRHFRRVAKCETVEVVDGKALYVEFAGNLSPVVTADGDYKSGPELALPFRAFTESLLTFKVRAKDPTRDLSARLALMRQPNGGNSSDAVRQPVCELNIVLPDVYSGDSIVPPMASLSIAQ